MKKFFCYGLLTFVFAMQSCVKDDYDLRNLDTTVSVPVTELTLPLNLDDIQLRTVLDISENSKIREYNGEYAVVVNGEFETEMIKVDNISAKGSSLANILGKSFKKEPQNVSNVKTWSKTPLSLTKMIASYDIPDSKTELSISAEKVTDAIKSLKDLNINTKVCSEIVLDKENVLSHVLKTQHIENFSFKIPKGFEGTLSIISNSGEKITADTIDVNTGIATFNSTDIVATNGILRLEFNVTKINENVLKETWSQIAEDNTFNITDTYGVYEGKIAVYDEDFTDEYSTKTDKEKYNSLPNELDYESQQNMDEIQVNGFSGKLDYAIKDFDIDPIDLSDIPDMLNQTGTYLLFDNPQIYLQVENPIKDGNGQIIPIKTSFEIASIDKNGRERKYDMDKGENVNADNSLTFFYMSPQKLDDKDKYAGYEKAKYIKYSSLGDILSGGGEKESLGVPTSLYVSTKNARVEAENVNGLELGREIGKINGKYVFYAPLALKDGSRIKYATTIDGWNCEEIDEMVINNLKLTCKVSTDVPFSLNMKVIPIDKDGKRINATATAAVQAKANEQELEIFLDGEIRHLDGIVVETIANAESNDVLRPNMKIKLGRVKATVTGVYQY